MTNLYAMLRARLAQRDRGATAVEYGLLVALIAGVIIAVVYFLGQTLEGVFSDVEDCLASIDDPDCPGDTST